uniref:DDE-1 domain-containing protein n=1 Tax=Rodentolepis nana TaxID=102285 RepID=A0A0R3T425_RODNA
LCYNGTGTNSVLLLASSDISDDPGSGHKPVIATITIGSKRMIPKMPTKLPWNFKKAGWPRFTYLLENELHTSPINILANLATKSRIL